VNTSTLAVRAGSVYLYSHDVGRLQVSRVDRAVLRRPSLGGDGGGLDAGVALVRLARALDATTSVRAVCLHSGAAVYAQPGSGGYATCVVAGWPPSRADSSCTNVFHTHHHSTDHFIGGFVNEVSLG